MAIRATPPRSRLSTPSWASWTPRLTPVVALDADHDVLMERMKKRAEIEGRSDDTPEAIAKRLDVYAKETAPLLDIYQKRGLLKTFNGVGAVDEIQATIVAELG